ncbi:T9SS type B sorting domain-containing protein [Lacinutrix sp. C3R15]|uniref:T9SS type B sorting domain-containing protein n=1 Tax=Flavobacteriaceae TaxID=49546 RepID=UPI001C0A4317|nr:MULTISPECIES: T9SS type B sorting domain-containing protein [Flavobacteriaceae]MBU2940667.1 T9SS type B sorting domain-containing protein [Lacinutrix sp. C3R15]MDO6623985.1 T9SS type B sorting domain-containing protein [Oceanihabitans sp. 1_MG-2023]
MKTKHHIFTLLITSLFVQFSFAQLPTDCIDAVIVCGNSNVNLDANGIGTQELSGSNTCASSENNSLWLQVTVINDGTLGFTLTPSSPSTVIDYDFFVFGPNVSCGNIGQAIRCSTTNPQAAGQGNNLTGMNGTETDTTEGPGADGNSFVRWLDVLAGETYYIVLDRPVGTSPFTLEWTGTAEFAEPPTNEVADTTTINIEECDVVAPYDDGFTTFNLEVNTAAILGSQTDVLVSYHESESDANININPLTSPYTNSSNPKTIYTRLTNTTTGCFNLVSFELTVNPGPQYNAPSDIESCDDYSDGDAFNNATFFDLESKNDEILNGQNPALFNITYHETNIDAVNNTAALTSPYLSVPKTIHVRIEDAANPTCKNVFTINLVTLPAPNSFNSSLFQCDEDGTVDGITAFNLFEAEDALTGGATNTSLKFYSSFINAQNSSMEIDGTNYINSTNPETVYVQVINNTTECFSIAELTLETSTTQIQDYNAPEACDEPNSEDGINTFDLNAFTTDIQAINGITFPITYYENYTDALLEQNELATPYTNTTPYTQILFARAEDNNACYGINEVTLTINELPELLEDETIFYCLNTYPATIELQSGVIGNPNNYTYQWSTGETTNQIQINEIGSYTVTVINAENCQKSRTITVEASNTATIDLVEVVDGTISNTITVNASGEGTYEYALYDNQGNPYVSFQTSNFFSDIYPGMYTIAVKDTKNNCGTVTQSVSVVGFPQYFTPNNDGYHDTWQVLGVSNLIQPNTTVKIFNRYGKLIQQISPLTPGWDGTFNGANLPSDDYWFAITLQDGREYFNHFSLIR